RRRPAGPGALDSPDLYPAHGHPPGRLRAHRPIRPPGPRSRPGRLPRLPVSPFPPEPAALRRRGLSRHRHRPGPRLRPVLAPRPPPPDRSVVPRNPPAPPREPLRPPPLSPPAPHPQPPHLTPPGPIPRPTRRHREHPPCHRRQLLNDLDP